MNTYSGPSAADLERIELWKSWIESYYSEIGKAIGPSPSKGALRSFGAFDFGHDATAFGVVLLYIATRANLPLLTRANSVKWEIVSPEKAANVMLAQLERIKAEPMYVLTMRAQRSLEKID